MAEGHGSWIATVLTAYSHFQQRVRRAAFLYGKGHQPTNTGFIDTLEWVVRIHARLDICGEE